MIDLHMHSNSSDGTDSPEMIISKASKLRFSLCSITDHDTICGQDKAVKTARELNVSYLTGIEFSAKYSCELHILGYGMDIHNSELAETLQRLQQSRILRIEKIINKLAGLNKKLTFEEVKSYSEGKSIGRPHIARAMVERGYAADLDEAFGLYLGENGSCYEPREKLDQKQVVDLINNAGGVAVLAHPKFVRVSSFDDFAGHLHDIGFWGIEAFYPAHTNPDAFWYERVARKKGLYITAGSDYHGANKKTAFGSEKRTSNYLKESMEVLCEKAVR